MGVPSEKYGEEVCAFIKLSEDGILTEDEIRDFCKEGISRFKIPRYIIFTDSFPMTASGKIKKNELREIASSNFGLNDQNT